MTTRPCKLSVDLKEGEVLSIDGGRYLLKVEKKSGRQARLVFEFKQHTDVVKLPLRGQSQEVGVALGPV